ncbi:MAG TPA: flagellar hook-basal body complex protein FliE [Spirochaetota bacterium]|nr:flagellar hook-basal body complex protein FliE [Spirochaetota bacterium]HPI90660.1 flagellar hook-basal body complex protein FliE [Spirochaetota bacterium]HPR49688.1 flagellar hook-basal body complex protein FliE [Spirochaetota bacterium]
MIGTTESASGYIIRMKTSNPLHYDNAARNRLEPDDVSGSFAQALNAAVGRVNNLQVDSEELTQKMIYEPESVDIHTVMIAAQKAEIALSFTKSIRDEAIRAYRELINLR